MVDSSFLTEKGIGGLPNWAVGLIGVGGAVLIVSWRRNTAASAANATQNPATSASQQPPNVFVVPGATTTVTSDGQQTAPPPVGRPTVPAGSGDVISATGTDMGQYLYGSNEVAYIQQNLGKYGFTQRLYSDVQQAYANVVAMYGQDTADQYHYAWYANGNVRATPPPNSTGLQAIQALGPGTAG